MVPFHILITQEEVDRSLGRPSGRWKDNIKMYLQEVGWVHGLD